ATTDVDDKEDIGRKERRKVRFAGENGEHDGDYNVDEEGDDEDDQDDASDDDNADVAPPEDFEKKFRQRQNRDSSSHKGGKDELAFADSDSDLGSISGSEPELDEDRSDEDEDEDEDELDDSDVRWKENLADTLPRR
ncbi:hypothetical protein KEM55_008887, partial [Ascosphaera atra]